MALPILALAVACTEPAPPAAPLAVLRARPVPARVQARFTATVHDRHGVIERAEGALRLERPGRALVEVTGPLGGTRARLIADGQALALDVPDWDSPVVGPFAEDVLRGLSLEALGLDDAVGLLVGDLPLDRAQPSSPGPAGEVRAVDETTGLGLQVIPGAVADRPAIVGVGPSSGPPAVHFTYADWSAVDDLVVPGRVSITLHRVGLRVDLRLRDWRLLDPGPPPAAVESG